MLAVCVGDLHFDGTLATHVDNHHLYVASEFAKACSYAKTHGIPNVIMLGDFGERTRMSYEANKALVSVLRKYSMLKFWGIPGNHDLYTDSALDGHSVELVDGIANLPNFRFFTEPTTIKIDDAHVRFLPYPSVDFDASALNIFHNDVYGSHYPNGRPIKHEGAARSKAVCIGGHLHDAHRVRNTYYPGTLYQTRFDESPKKYFAVVDFQTPDSYDVQLIPTRPKYRLIKANIESRADIDNLSRDPCDLISLHVAHDANVSVADWSERPNIVKHDFKAPAAQTGSVDGEELSIDVDDFLIAWMRIQGIPDAEQRDLMEVRNRYVKRAA